MRPQFFAENGPDDAGIEQYRQGLEQVPDLKEIRYHQRIGRGQFKHVAGVPVEQLHAKWPFAARSRRVSV